MAGPIKGKLSRAATAALCGTQKRKACAKCGFAMPKYVGRYPRHCPVCDAETGVPSAKSNE
jgi:hypothetical protein